MVESASDGVRLGNTLEHVEQMGSEALHAERDAVDAGRPQRAGELLRDRLGICLDGDLACTRERSEQALERTRFGERRRPAAEEDRLQLGGKQLAFQLELAKQSVDIGAVLPATAHHRDEVAIATPV